MPVRCFWTQRPENCVSVCLNTCDLPATCELMNSRTQTLPQASDPRGDISRCRLCADRFSMTKTQHAPRPVVWFDQNPRILIAGQAPGQRVHQSGKPFDDPSGDRLREWMGIDRPVFYDRSRVSIMPMAFCFPGYDAKGSDLPPPKVCASTWHERATRWMGAPLVTFLVGGYAHKWHLGGNQSVTDRVADWRALAPQTFILPHPSWRNTGWIKRNPWFETDVLPEVRAAVRKALA